MKKTIITLLIALCAIQLTAQRGIGTTSPSTNAILHLASADSAKGLIIPIVTTTKRPSPSSAIVGMMVYNLTDSCIQVCNGVDWNCLKQIYPTDTTEWSNEGLYIMAARAAANGDTVVITDDGKMGIGTNTPAAKLEVEGGAIIRGDTIQQYNIGGFTAVDPGIQTFGVARYFSDRNQTGPFYLHLIFPARYNSANYKMFFLELKGYIYNSNTTFANLLNFNIAGYVSPPSNGGPISKIAIKDLTGDSVVNASVYYSTTLNRAVCKLEFTSIYFLSFVVNTIAVGNGDVIKPGEIQIIERTTATNL